MEVEDIHVIKIDDLIESISKLRDSLEGASKEYEEGFRDACLSMIQHYTEVLQELKDSSEYIVHH